MKIYYHPASTTSRPIILFAAQTGMAADFEVVDLFTGAHHRPEFEKINPNRLVPVLEDGDFRLTESSAILKYMAEKAGSDAYPAGLKERARVNERMDWTNTQLCRDLAYGLVYPQIFEFHKRPDPAVHAATLQWAQERARGWMKVLDRNLLAGAPWLAGERITLADYFAAPFVALSEAVGTSLGSDYPTVAAWLARMKSLTAWTKVNEVIDGYTRALPGPFQPA